MNRRETGIFTALTITAAAVIVLVVSALWATTDGFAAWSSNLTLTAADDGTPIAGNINVINAGAGIDATVNLGSLTINALPTATAQATSTPQPTATPNVIKPAVFRAGGDRWAVPGWEFIGFQSTAGLTNDVLYFLPLRVQYAQTWTQIGFRIDTAATNGIVRVCLYGTESVPYSDDGLDVGILIHDFSTVSATTTGSKTIIDTVNVNATSGNGGFYWMGVVARGDTPVQMRTLDQNTAFNSPASGQNPSVSGSLNYLGLSSSASTSYIDSGCPSDGTGLGQNLITAETAPTVWVKENG